ncbi:ATP-binding protein, partial [Candidatus Bipolaricaulota bacterium]|nr:ATP-binding protein [Candidatus Bipolaricaulota bacterium]
MARMINARKGNCLVFLLVLLSFCYVAFPATADDPSIPQTSPISKTKNVFNPGIWESIGIAVIGGLILYVILKFLQPVHWLTTHFKRTIQYHYGNPYAALDGGAQLLNRKLLLRSVEPMQVRLYYEGVVRLSWGIIAACADIKRDKQEDLVKLLRSKYQTGKLSIVCVTGEPGAGKSTLAWRTAAKLYKEDRSLVLWMKKRNDAEMWLRLEETAGLAQRKCYVLVDDLFHDDEVLQAVSQIDPLLPLTILATSGQHEFRHCGLTCELLEFPLGLPTKHEKRGMLEKLGKRMEDLTPDQRKRLDNATQFRVLMAELTTGKGHIEAIQETVRQLCSQDPIAYDAYLYICFATQSIPETTLEQIRPGELYKVIERASVRGFIYRDVVNSTRLNAGHPTRAAAAFAVYHRSAQQVLLKIVGRIDQTCRDSRYFVAFLVLKVLAADRSDLDSVLSELAQPLLGISNNAKLISEGLMWCKCFQNLGMSEAVEGIERRLPSMSPVSNNECRKLLRVCRKRGREKDALPAIAKFVYQNPNASQ